MQVLQLRPIAGRPAGLALKPLKPIIAHSANRASSSWLRPLLHRISHSSSAPLPAAPCSVRRMGRCSCLPALRTKARDDEAEQAPVKQGEDQAPAERKEVPWHQRSMAHRLFADVYVCAYICSYRIGELIVVNAQEGLDRLRRYVRDNFFNEKR